MPCALGVTGVDRLWADVTVHLLEGVSIIAWLVATAGENDHIPLGFQGLSSADMCVEVAGAYAAQKADINISLTAIGLLWTTADFFARGQGGLCISPCNADASSPSPSISSSTAAAFPAPAPPPGAARGLTAVGPGRPEISVSSPLAHQLFQTGPITSPGDAGAAFGAVASKLDKRSGDLLMGVFGVIQGLGTDERPEAATASRDEWVGTELGKSAGKSVHMLVHHSRNTAQKQWDETLVMVFNGMSRLFKSFFPLLQAMEGFKQAWASLLQFVEESVLEGSKEVAGAAVTALYVGNVPRYYWESAFQTYEVIVRGSAHANSRVALKARQEILEHLGELYNQSPALFDKDDYVRALALVDVLARFPSHPGEPAAYARTVIDILPKLQPAEASHQPLWPSLLRQLLAYLPGGDRLLCDHCRVPARFLPESKRPGGPGFAGGAELDAYSQQIQLRHQQAGARRGGGSSGVSGADGGDHAHALGTLGNEGAELSEHTHAGPQDAYAAALAAAERLIGTPDGPGSFHLDENGHAQGSGAAADDVEPGHASAAGAPGPPLGSSSAAAPAAAGPGKLPTTTATATTVLTPNAAGGGVGGSSRGKGFSLGGQSELFAPTAVWSGTAENRTGAFMLGFPETAPGALSQVFVERVVALLLLLFRAAPPDVKASTLPDFIAALGRCMAVRRDSPTSQLWRTALVAFHEVLDLALLPDGSGSGSGVGSYHGGGGGGNASADDEDQEGDGGEAGGGVLLLGRQLHAAGSGSSGGGVGSGGAGAGAGAGPGRARLWKEVADVFEKFLLGACGRAASVVGGGSGGEESGGAGGGGGQAAEGLRSDEELEALVLDALCNKVLLCCRDAPEEVKDRLVAVLDLCAGRMSALPLTAVALLPPHCGRFSLACLHRLFVLARCMAVRRDSPTSQLWRTALVAFHEVLDLALLPDGSGSGSGVGSYHGGGGGGNASADDEDQEGDGGEAGGGVLLLGRQLHAAGSGSSGGGVGSGGAGAGAGAGPGRARLWKEVADVFEKFLLGACGRAASVVGGGSGGEESGGAGGGGGQAAEGLRSDEELEALVLDALCNKVLLCCRDAPEEVKDRLVAVLDLCAGRMSALPLTAVALLPPHCGRFSLACLHRLFVLASRGAPEDAPNASSVAIGRKAMPVLVARCESILQRFTADALNCGARPLPTMRVEEVVVLLQEMARLTIHRHVAAAVDVPICHKDLEDEVDCRSPRARWAARKPTPQRFYDEAGRQLGWQRAHLLLLYTPLCELLLTRRLLLVTHGTRSPTPQSAAYSGREPRVAELLRVVLRLIGAELGLLKE
eukprot:jgi/Mesen1/9441/ME000626S08699